MLSAVASRYARALVEVAAAPGSGSDPAVILTQLRAVGQAIADSAELRTALLSPSVPPGRKRAIVQRVFHSIGGAAGKPPGLDKQARNFLFVVIDHRRVAELPSIVDAFEALLDERLGFVRADVLSARHLTGTEQGTLQAEISRMTGRKAKLKFSIEPALIAGVVARIGSTVYDGSVRGQLDTLRLKLAKG
jgi:F-type H+-transporting ATPase subunit delta